MFYTDQQLIEGLADELPRPSDRRLIDKVLRASHYHPVPDPPRKADPKIEKATAEVYAELAAAKVEHQRAKDAWLIALSELPKAATVEQIEVRRAIGREAEQSYQEANQRVERLLGRLSTLQQRQAELHRREVLAEVTAR